MKDNTLYAILAVLFAALVAWGGYGLAQYSAANTRNDFQLQQTCQQQKAYWDSYHNICVYNGNGSKQQ